MYDALYLADPPLDLPKLYERDRSFEIRLESLSRYRREVSVPATVRVVAPEGSPHASVSSSATFVFPANNINGVWLPFRVADDDVDALLGEYQVVVTLREPGDGDDYHLIYPVEHEYPVGVLVDGICDRLAPMREAILREVRGSHLLGIACHEVSRLELASLESRLAVTDDAGHSFGAGAMAGLVNVPSVLLSASSDTTLQEGFLAGADSLKFFTVTGVDSDTIASGAFSGVPRLTELAVRGDFDSVADGAFVGVPQLETVYYEDDDTDVLDVPLKLVLVNESPEGEDDPWKEHVLEVASGAPFDILGRGVATAEGLGDVSVVYLIPAGARKSLPVRVGASYDIDVTSWHTVGMPQYSGFMFRLPQYMDMMDDDPVTGDQPVATVSGVASAVSDYNKLFSVSLSEAAVGDVEVRYSYGVGFVDYVGPPEFSEIALGDGVVKVASGASEARFGLDLSDILLLPPSLGMNFRLWLADPMAADGYALPEGGSSVTILLEAE